MDLKQVPKMQSREVNSDGRPVNLPGIYKCKESGQEIITSADYDTGVAQADAIVATGEQIKLTWERIGDVPSGAELLKMRKAQEIKDATEEALQAGKEAEEMKAAKKKALEEAKAAVA